jgi:soluble lytic murein transglycosylase-like protein
VPITLAVLFASPSNLASDPVPVREVAVEVSRSYTAVEVKQEPERLFRVALEPELQELVYSECMARGVDPYLAVSVMLRENRGFDPSIISASNDYGLFQINRINHKRMADLGYTDMLNAEDNIRAGVYILAECLNKNSNYHQALMAYNLGQGGANKAMAKGIYSTDYSRGVMAFYDGLKAGVSYE